LTDAKHVSDMEAVTRMADSKRDNVLAAAAAGDEFAFRQIISEHHKDMYRVCMAISGDRAVTDEATQAAWVIAWKRIGDVREPSHLRPWLVTVAANEARQLLRRRRRQAAIASVSDAAGEPGGIAPATGAAALDLGAAVARLDPDDRALLAVRYVAGFDATEIGTAMGKSPAAIRQRLKRLLDRLREDLDDGSGRDRLDVLSRLDDRHRAREALGVDRGVDRFCGHATLLDCGDGWSSLLR
jgi:RNA polymerase sigma-70 factor (ECF subfamily)